MIDIYIYIYIALLKMLVQLFIKVLRNTKFVREKEREGIRHCRPNRVSDS